MDNEKVKGGCKVLLHGGVADGQSIDDVGMDVGLIVASQTQGGHFRYRAFPTGHRGVSGAGRYVFDHHDAEGTGHYRLEGRPPLKHE